ncbi:MAG: HEAT repeat domain-containing protein [Thermodesulfobacteriota bacterium]
MKRHQLIGAAMMLLILAVPLAAMADSAVSRLKHANTPAEYGAIFEEILDQGDASAGELLALLREDVPAGDPAVMQKAWEAKVTAMNLLGEMKAQSALVLLGDMLKDSDNVSAIYNAGRAIGRIGGTNAFNILKNILAETAGADNELSEARKKAAIVGLGLCENEQAIELLRDELNNAANTDIVRIYAAGSLGMLGVNDGLDVVKARLDSEDADIRLAAIRALGLIGDADAIADLNNAVGPNGMAVPRRAAQLSVAQITAARMTGDEKVRFIEKELMKNSHDTAFIQWGTMQLKKIRSSASMNALASLAGQPGQEMAILRQAARIRMKSAL